MPEAINTTKTRKGSNTCSFDAVISQVMNAANENYIYESQPQDLRGSNAFIDFALMILEKPFHAFFYTRRLKILNDMCDPVITRAKALGINALHCESFITLLIPKVLFI